MMKALPTAIAGAHFHRGIMAGKLNGVMPATTPKRLTHGIHVNAGACGIGEFALHEMRHATGKFGDFNAALQIAQRIGNGLAVFHGNEGGQFFLVLGGELQKFHHYPATELRVLGGPGGLGRLGVFDGGAELGFGGQSHLGLHFARIGVEHIGKPPRCPLDLLATDEMPDFLDHFPLSLILFDDA